MTATEIMQNDPYYRFTKIVAVEQASDYAIAKVRVGATSSKSCRYRGGPMTWVTIFGGEPLADVKTKRKATLIGEYLSLGLIEPDGDVEMRFDCELGARAARRVTLTEAEEKELGTWQENTK